MFYSHGGKIYIYVDRVNQCLFLLHYLPSRVRRLVRSPAAAHHSRHVSTAAAASSRCRLCHVLQPRPRSRRPAPAAAHGTCRLRCSHKPRAVVPGRPPGDPVIQPRTPERTGAAARPAPGETGGEGDVSVAEGSDPDRRPVKR